MAKRGFGRGSTSSNEKVKITRKGLKDVLGLFRFILPYKNSFILGCIFLFFSGLTALTFPFVSGKLIDAASDKYDAIFTNIHRTALILIGILLVQSIFSFFRIVLFSRVSEHAMADIRKTLYSKLITLPIAFFEKRRVGELTGRLTSDVTQLQDVLSVTFAEFIRQIITLTAGITILLVTSPKLTLFMLGTFPLLVGAALIFGRFIRKISKTVQDELADANVIVEETFQNINTVKAFTNEPFETKRYGSAMERVVGYALKAARWRGGFVSFVIFALFGGIVAVLWYGAGLVESGAMSIGQLTSFIIYTAFIGGSVGGLGEIYGQLQRTIGASERIREILGETPETISQLYVEKSRFQGHIHYKNVSFSYPSRLETPVLKNIDFTVTAGSRTAFVGHSGAGKSTIVQLLMRFYDTTEGSITIDGHDVQEVDLQTLRQNIGVVPQEILLFGGTIRENIAYGKSETTEEEIREAARKAYALDFIEAFPQGFDTVVGERGIKLSGGQRQRIAIARTILKDPAILILDEATGALDAESERAVQQALNELMKNRTVLIIAHRLATIRSADRILVVENGKIAEQGSHEELLNGEEGIYSRMVKLQYY